MRWRGRPRLRPQSGIEGLNHDLTADLNKASETERTSVIGGEAEILLNQSITGFKAVATDESRLTRSRTPLDARASRPCCRNRHRPVCGTKSSWVPAAVPHRDSTHSRGAHRLAVRRYPPRSRRTAHAPWLARWMSGLPRSRSQLEQ